MTVTIHDAQAHDAPAVHAVTQAAYGAAPPLDPPSGALSETVDDVAADLEAGGGLLAIQDGRPVASLRYGPDGRAMWLRRVGVVPEMRRHGVGSRLVAHAHAELAHRGDVEQFRVRVRAARPGARRFWLGLSYADARAHGYWTEMRREPPYVGVVPTAAAMRRLGGCLADVLQAGDIVVCVGGLGAGKTTLAQGVAGGLGVRGDVTSPTFVLAREHAAAPGGRGLPFVHVDAYRLGSVADPLAEVDALDLDATLDDAVTFVEWGEGLVERLAVNRVEIRLEVTVGSEERRVIVDALGPRWSTLDISQSFKEMA